MFRQGDVLIRKVPNNTKFEGTDVKYNTKENFLTVIKGETTNHHHGFAEPEVAVKFLRVEEGVPVYLANIPAPTKLVHFNVKTQQLTNEHTEIAINEPGMYEIRGQREAVTSGQVTQRGWGQQVLFRTVQD